MDNLEFIEFVHKLGADAEKAVEILDEIIDDKDLPTEMRVSLLRVHTTMKIHDFALKHITEMALVSQDAIDKIRDLNQSGE